MVPEPPIFDFMDENSPRIRGDGPNRSNLDSSGSGFSPYSRGWSVRRSTTLHRSKNSPRIRGDGPNWPMKSMLITIFSPYSRGWSLTLKTTEWDGLILPVFAGMVPRRRSATPGKPYFPRIRGDGPTSCPTQPPTTVFSPYSRGWSSITPTKRRGDHIFPVFAGMVPRRRVCRRAERYFPRIRGDGPSPGLLIVTLSRFSPYSRGWSPVPLVEQGHDLIFPVFAGMVPGSSAVLGGVEHFPRIRGDGPWWMPICRLLLTFSPYSRGWSRVRLLKWAPRRIFPVFAGMIPAQIALSSALMVILPHYDPD